MRRLLYVYKSFSPYCSHFIRQSKSRGLSILVTLCAQSSFTNISHTTTLVRQRPMFARGRISLVCLKSESVDSLPQTSQHRLSQQHRRPQTFFLGSLPICAPTHLRARLRESLYMEPFGTTEREAWCPKSIYLLALAHAACGSRLPAPGRMCGRYSLGTWPGYRRL